MCVCDKNVHILGLKLSKYMSNFHLLKLWAAVYSETESQVSENNLFGVRQII